MNATFNRIRLFKWKAGLTFCGTFGASMASALATSGAETSWQQWVLAGMASVGAACFATVALFTQLEQRLDNQAAPAAPPAP